jgi:hypothetical protein
MFNQLCNLIINSTTHYILFYAIGFIFGINDFKQLDIIGTIGFIYGSTYDFIKR